MSKTFFFHTEHRDTITLKSEDGMIPSLSIRSPYKHVVDYAYYNVFAESSDESDLSLTFTSSSLEGLSIPPCFKNLVDYMVNRKDPRNEAFRNVLFKGYTYILKFNRCLGGDLIGIAPEYDSKIYVIILITKNDASFLQLVRDILMSPTKTVFNYSYSGPGYMFRLEDNIFQPMNVPEILFYEAIYSAVIMKDYDLIKVFLSSQSLCLRFSWRCANAFYDKKSVTRRLVQSISYNQKTTLSPSIEHALYFTRVYRLNKHQVYRPTYDLVIHSEVKKVHLEVPIHVSKDLNQRRLKDHFACKNMYWKETRYWNPCLTPYNGDNCEFYHFIMRPSIFFDNKRNTDMPPIGYFKYESIEYMKALETKPAIIKTLIACGGYKKEDLTLNVIYKYYKGKRYRHTQYMMDITGRKEEASFHVIEHVTFDNALSSEALLHGDFTIKMEQSSSCLFFYRKATSNVSTPDYTNLNSVKEKLGYRAPKMNFKRDIFRFKNVNSNVYVLCQKICK